MRVIGGKYRGKKLLSPINDARPTLDRIKENVFNILSQRLMGSNFLDLFGGTGGIGIEALSRGANVTIVEKDDKSIKVIRDNLKGIKEEVNLIKSDSIKFLTETDLRFDIIYADPPYDAELYENVKKSVQERDLLKDGGVLVLESDTVIEDNGNLVKYDERKYGRVYLSFYKKGE